MADSNPLTNEMAKETTINSQSYLNNTGNRYCDLFNVPASSAPVIFSLISAPGCFNSLTLLKTFINLLVDVIGPVGHKVVIERKNLHLPQVEEVKGPATRPHCRSHQVRPCQVRNRIQRYHPHPRGWSGRRTLRTPTWKSKVKTNT